MANELVINHPTGSTLYALLFDATGQIWNGSAFAAPGSAAWADYDIAMSEVATATGVYRASMPAVTAGVYGWVVYKQKGASPAVTDGPPVGTGRIEWSGTAEIMPASTTNITGGTINSVTGNIEGKVLGGGSGVFVADGVQVAASAGGLTAQETANAVHNLAPVGVAATGSMGANLDSILNGLTGVGLIPLAYTVTEPNGITPIEGVTVELYTEQACLNCVRRGITNSFGVAVFWLSTAGTYWIKSAKDGYSFGLDSETITT